MLLVAHSWLASLKIERGAHHKDVPLSSLIGLDDLPSAQTWDRVVPYGVRRTASARHLPLASPSASSYRTE